MRSNEPAKPRSNGNEILPPWFWGVFKRAECTGAMIFNRDDNSQSTRTIYLALKDIGFRETYWQYVYPGQIGGLVRNPRRGLIEHHIRFFDDGRIYAEIEFGRSAILHFLNKRMYLNQYVLAKIRSRISVADASYFCDAVKRHKAASRVDWLEWSMKNRFYTSGVKNQIRLLTLLGDWRILAVLMLASFGIASGYQPDGPLLPILVASMIIIYIVAPKRI